MYTVQYFSFKKRAILEAYIPEILFFDDIAAVRAVYQLVAPLPGLGGPQRAVVGGQVLHNLLNHIIVFII